MDLVPVRPAVARPDPRLYAPQPMSFPARVSTRLLRGIPALLLSPILGSGLGAQDEPRQTESERVLQLSLEDAVRIALEQNLGLEAEAIATEVARFNALGSWGSFDPIFSTTGTAQEQEQQGQSQLSGGSVVEDDSLQLNSSLSLPLTTGGSVDLTWFHSNDRTTNSFSLFDTSTTDVVTLSVRQPLLKGAWERYATTLQREREIDLSTQTAREKEIRQRLVLDVYHAYWDLVSAIELVGVRVLAVDRAQTQLGQDKRRLELGAGTEIDVLQSETTLAQQEERLLNARFQQRQAEDNLRRMLFQKPSGAMEEFLLSWDWPIEPLTPLPRLPADETPAPDWRRSWQLAIERRAELWQRRLAVDRAEVQLAASESGRLPTLDLNLSSSSAGFDSDPDEALSEALGWDFPTNTASLEFRVPLRNRSANYAERAARAAVRQAHIALDRQELDILAEVREAVRDLRYRAEALLATEKSSMLAERQLKAERVRMDIGLSTTFQVLQFQETLATARSDEVAARAAFAKALVKLDHVEGGLDPKLGADE